ncbi:MAG: glutathione synthase [Myxococcales bacterium]|nr:glutathione synthase [Myxococcales bacterium]
MQLVVIMDPVATVKVDEDTTFALMLEAQSRGHALGYCEARDVSFERGRVVATVRPATVQRDPSAPIVLGPPARLDLGEADAVLIRKDPPFDASYWWLTLLLEHLEGETLVVNRPRGLREANEKLYALHFAAVMPETIVDADKARIRRFVEAVGGRAVIKPIDGHGGEGVFALVAHDPNLNGLIEAVTRGGREQAMVQAFIPEVAEGDKRILLIDGEPLGAILRVPQGGDVRSNIHVGGAVVHAEITAADQRIIEAVAPRLRADGLWFVGLDVIGGLLTEVNVTSPTGIQQMSRLSGESREAPVLDWIEAHARA